jgi:Flp pilus assembly pilin Flp
VNTFLRDQVRLNMMLGIQKTWIDLLTAVKQEDGQDLVEYGLLGLLVCTVVVGILSVVGTDLANSISQSASVAFP